MFPRLIVFICWFVLSLFGFNVTSLPGQDNPNVVLIMTDDQGWWDVGAHGNPYIETPVIDQLITESVEFTQFYASPVCTPTRASLLTGRHYQRTGAFDTYMGRDTLRAEEITLGEVFQGQGYHTGLFGKWHLGRYMKYHPNNQGFRDFFGFWQYGFINRYFDPNELFDNHHRVTSTGYVTDILTDRAISFVRSNSRNPFFLYLPFNAPHSPFLVPDSYIEKYIKKGLPLREARVYGMITNIDENIGRLLKTVADLGLNERTVVIFMSDNGGVSTYFKAGLRGGKGSVYEGGVRVPFLVRWPSHFPAGVKVEAIAQHIDIFPTLCELIGVPLRSDQKVDGKSLLTLIKNGGGLSPHEYLFHQWSRVRPNPEKNWAVRNQRYKLVMGGDPSVSSNAFFRHTELFDIKNDEGEKINIASRHPQIAQRFQEEFEKWFSRVTSEQNYGRVPIEVGHPDENPVEIDLTWGEPAGHHKLVQPTYRHYNRDTIENWTEEGDSVRWKIEILEGGQYEVIFSYGCYPGNAGGKFRISVGNVQLDGVVESTPGRLIFRRHRIGTMELPEGSAILEIKPILIVGQELMALHKIWLRRLL